MKRPCQQMSKVIQTKRFHVRDASLDRIPMLTQLIGIQFCVSSVGRALFTWEIFTIFETLCSTRNFFCSYIAIGWAIAIAETAVFFLPGCDYYFDPAWYSWSYDLTTDCGTYITLFDLYYGGSFFVVIFTINMLTLLNLRKMNAVMNVSCRFFEVITSF